MLGNNFNGGGDITNNTNASLFLYDRNNVGILTNGAGARTDGSNNIFIVSGNALVKLATK